ncbi:cytochrome P450 [Brevibacterium luteolum]|nr:cytochrome P450 [Brevibacterium luteolum]MBU8578186.1 cytochrome P450 [Brevibacterium luteolum]
MTSHNQSRQAPVADWVQISELYADPFPIYERLREEGGVHWVPAVNRYLITSYEAVSATEHNQEVFSADEEGSLQIRAMGHSMLRRDDPEHYEERRAWQPTLTPGYVKRVWTQMYREVAEQQLEQLVEKGPGADLIWDFAAPYAAECLRRMLGLYNADQGDLQRWSQTMIDATGNYADDPDVWAAGERSFNEVDAALDEMLAYHRDNRDESMLSGLLSMPGELMPLEKIRANIKMTIGGGLNEPRDALGVAAWALFRNPDQLADVMADQRLWPTVFEETIRWVAPIGMYSRQVTRDTDLAGTFLPAGAKLGICVLSANRDETIWSEPERFDIHREVKPHLAFSKGTHVCLGSWAARAEIADVALPLLFNSLKNLSIDDSQETSVGGWVFRGMLSLPVTWTSASTTPIYAPAQAASDPGGSAASNPGPTVAIVGAGPSGCFSAKEILREIPNARVDVLDQLPLPYGLLRYGVAADHQGTKSVSAQFDRVFAHPRVRFIGNTALGDDVTMEELKSSYDAVVMATGAPLDRPLTVPGADRPQVYQAGSITRLLNGHPDEAGKTDRPVALGTRTAVIGNGNVAIDIVRLLTCDSEALDGSDIHDERHAHLRDGIKRIDILGRSAAAEAKFDPVMIRELARTPGLTHVLHGDGIDDGPVGKDAKLDALRTLPTGPVAERPENTIEVHWWFDATPDSIVGDDDANVSDLDVTQHGQVFRLEVDSVITAIGFVKDPAALARNGICPVSAIPSDGKIDDGLYAIGWLKGEGRGTIPDQRNAGRQLAATIAADLRSGEIGCGASGIDPHENATDFRGWQRIDLKERLQAAPGRCRSKITTLSELLSTAGDDSMDDSLQTSDQPVDQDSISCDMPLSILFGTESGNAELVAEELATFIGGDQDIQVADLATVSPSELDSSRFHLIVCSTYGDGEVPSSAGSFYRELQEDRPDLSGINYAVFGLGDASYTKTYSRGSELLSEELEACGAARLGEYGRHDAGGSVPAEEAAREWVEGVIAAASAQLQPA